MLAQWREIDVQITEAANEAKDNVKYLSTLERFFDPLYGNDPGAITDTLPGDIYTYLYTCHTVVYVYFLLLIACPKVIFYIICSLHINPNMNLSPYSWYQHLSMLCE